MACSLASMRLRPFEVRSAGVSRGRRALSSLTSLAEWFAAGRDPRIHVFCFGRSNAWMPTELVRGLKAHGTSPAKAESAGRFATLSDRKIFPGQPCGSGEREHCAALTRQRPPSGIRQFMRLATTRRHLLLQRPKGSPVHKRAPAALRPDPSGHQRYGARLSIGDKGATLQAASCRPRPWSTVISWHLPRPLSWSP
jgi:hypothetical protein